MNRGDQFQLVKGCPTDINGNGYKDDDFNHDGNTDKDDQDYYDGYMDAYWDEYDPDNPGGGYSEAYLAGIQGFHEQSMEGEIDPVPYHPTEFNAYGAYY